jgi:hypothetical protein
VVIYFQKDLQGLNLLMIGDEAAADVQRDCTNSSIATGNIIISLQLYYKILLYVGNCKD